MPLFGMASSTEVKNQEDIAASIPYDAARDSTPGFLDESPQSFGRGFKGAALNLIGLGATGLHKSGMIGDESIKTFDEAFVDVKKQLAPDPQVTGYLGQILQPVTTMLAEAVPAIIAGGPIAGAALVGASEGLSETKSLKAEGVDESTAQKVGVVTGLTAGGSILLPAAIPGKIITRIASGAGINITVGGAQRGITGEILRKNGYKEMADQYKVLDSISILTDSILGGVFGGLAKSPRTLPSHIDTGLTANNIHQLEIESAPGIPADIQTRNSHVAAMETAADQIYRNEPVQVADKFYIPEFLAKEKNPEITEGMESALKEEGINELERQISQDRELQAEYESIVAAEENAKIPDKIIKSHPEKPPLSLLEWISKNGGVKDPHGDLQHLAAHEWHRGKPFASKLIKETGMNLDDATLSLWEQGYFREFGEDRPGINALYEKMDKELRGAKHYPDEFMLHLAEDPDYAAHISERMSEQRFERLNGEILDYHESLLADFEKQEMEWLTSRGEAWEPEEIQLASLEDLENEYRQESIARAPQEGEANDGQHRSATDIKGNGEETIQYDRDSSQVAGLKSTERLEEEDVGLIQAKNIAIEKPALQIADEDGNIITASEAITKADMDVDRAQSESGLFEVAVNCFIRNGL